MDRLEQMLTESFGLASFRPGQRVVIEAMLSGKHVLAVMPTGSGKSLCWQLPAVLGGGLTIVVSPLVALMEDQVRSMRDRGLPAAAIHASVEPSQRAGIFRDLSAGRLRMLYVAPERLSFEGFLDRASSLKVDRFVVDEAHCISEWGHDFRPEYQALRPAIRSLGAPPVAAFTATATAEVRQDIERHLGIEGATNFFTGFARENLRLSVRPAAGETGKQSALAAILAVRPGSAIVYCSTRREAESATRMLHRAGISAGCYHAGRSAIERGRIQRDFLEGRHRVVVATCAFGMGIDKRDIRTVIHHSLPGSVEAYYQEVGRAGRDGAPAEGILLWNPTDLALRRSLIERVTTSAEANDAQVADSIRLETMAAYAATSECRRRFIVDYFSGGANSTRCGECDNCRRRAD